MCSKIDKKMNVLRARMIKLILLFGSAALTAASLESFEKVSLGRVYRNADHYVCSRKAFPLQGYSMQSPRDNHTYVVPPILAVRELRMVARPVVTRHTARCSSLGQGNISLLSGCGFAGKVRSFSARPGYRSATGYSRYLPARRRVVSENNPGLCLVDRDVLTLTRPVPPKITRYVGAAKPGCGCQLEKHLGRNDFLTSRFDKGGRKELGHNSTDLHAVKNKQVEAWQNARLGMSSRVSSQANLPSYASPVVSACQLGGGSTSASQVSLVWPSGRRVSAAGSMVSDSCSNLMYASRSQLLDQKESGEGVLMDLPALSHWKESMSFGHAAKMV